MHIGLRKAYVFPVILLATLSVGFFIATLTQLQTSARRRLVHLNEYQRSFNIAYSGLVEILADLQKKQWSNRSFATSPVAGTKTLYGGTYNFWVEDHDPDEFLFNVRIRVSYMQRNYLFYWRLKYQPDLLDFTTLALPVYFTHFPGNDFNGTEDQVVNDDLARREANKEALENLIETVKQKSSVNEILDTILGSGISDNSLNPDTEIPAAAPLAPNPGSSEITSISEFMENPEVNQVLELSQPVLDHPLTRYKLTVFVVRCLQIPEVDDSIAVSTFSDVEASNDTTLNTFNRALSAAYENNLLHGYPDGTYGGNNLIERRHIAYVFDSMVDYINLNQPVTEPAIAARFNRILRWHSENNSRYEGSNEFLSQSEANQIVNAIR